MTDQNLDAPAGIIPESELTPGAEEPTEESIAQAQTKENSKMNEAAFAKSIIRNYHIRIGKAAVTMQEALQVICKDLADQEILSILQMLTFNLQYASMLAAHQTVDRIRKQQEQEKIKTPKLYVPPID